MSASEDNKENLSDEISIPNLTRKGSSGSNNEAGSEADGLFEGLNDGSIPQINYQEINFSFGEDMSATPTHISTCRSCQYSSSMADGAKESSIQLPSNYLREYKYLELENGIRVVLVNDALDMEVGIGIQYPIYLIEGCNELGGVRFISNVLIKGIKDYLREVALIKSYLLHNSKVSMSFSTNENLLFVLKYISEMFIHFEISMDAFLKSYKITIQQYEGRVDAQYTKIVNKLLEIAHPDSYLKSSCHTFYEPVLQSLTHEYDFVQLKKRMIHAIRNGISSNLLSLVITAPCSLYCSQLTISKGLSSMKNLNLSFPKILDSTYATPFSTSNLIGKILTLPTYLPIKQFFFCFCVEEGFDANLKELEDALADMFITGEQSLASLLKNRGLIKNMNIKVLLFDKSPILSFRVEVEDTERSNPAEILSIIRQVVYTFTESSLLEKYVMNYYRVRSAMFSRVFATSSTSDIIFNLFNIIDTSPLGDINNLINPKVLLDSVETVLSYTTFDHFFLIKSCNFTPEEVNNKTIEIDDINIEFWNSINANILSSYYPHEPEANPLLPSSYVTNFSLNKNAANITKIDFSDSDNTTLIDPYNSRVSMNIANGFQRPSTINFFRFDLHQDNYFSIKSILFKCFIVFAMNIFLRPYRPLFSASSVDLKINCGIDKASDLELGYDSISVYMSSHSKVFPQLLDYTSSSFNYATSLNETEFSTVLKEYRDFVKTEFTSNSGLVYARSILNGMLDPSLPSYSKYIKIIERVKHSDFVDYCESILSFNSLKGLISGNISAPEARTVLSGFINSLNLGKLTELTDPYSYNLPILMICPQPNMPRHFIIKRNQIDTSIMTNLVLVSVIIEKSIRNILVLHLLKNFILRPSELSFYERVALSLKWDIKKNHIQLNILTLSPIRYGENGVEPIIEYSTEILEKIYNLGNHIELMQKSFISKTKRIITLNRDSEETRFDQLYYSFMIGRKPFIQQTLLRESDSLTGKDFVDFANEVKNSLTYIIIISSYQQTNKNIEKDLPGFIFTEGYSNTK
ncbi:insulinase-like peptidase [Cryptosporidium canis]|uniref:Insulinase-like peptidase n=1 Tax=Cryptosporidium canis TaxID=195482 RepID=A0ABQ8P6A9_9CRYT|nr:insulinase-like peptidase [Cryptosporidium canis]